MIIPKDTTFIFIGVGNPLLCSGDVNDMFSMHLIGQGYTEKYYMVDIKSRTTLTNECELGKQYRKF